MDAPADSPSLELASASARRLLVRLSPYPDEAIAGFLTRLCLANGIAGLRALQRGVAELGGGISREGLVTATALSPKVVDALVGPYPSYWGVQANLAGLAAQDFNQQRLRWCPQCLGEKPYLHAAWTLKLSCVCVAHRLWLQERCPACGSCQTLAQTDFSRCRCGTSLSAAPQKSAPTKVLDLALAVEAAVFRGQGLHRWLNLSGAAWQRLVRYLGQFEAGGQPSRPGQLGNLHQLDLAAQIVTCAAALIDEWPRNFHALLATILQGQPNTPSLQRTFGRLYKVIYSDLADECYQFLRTAFEAFLNDSWWGLVCRRHRALDPASIAAHPRLPICKAAKRVGVGPRIIEHLAQASLIPVEQMSLPSGRGSLSMHQDHLPEVARLLEGSLSLGEAAKFLAIPRHRLRELVDSKVLLPLLAKREIRAARWMLPKEQIDRLAALSGPDVPGVKTVQICQVLKYWRLREGEFAALAQGLLDGEIRLVGCRASAPLANKTVALDVFKDWLGKRRLAVEEVLSIDQAANQLGLKQEVAYQLVRAGLIRSDSVVGRGRRISRKALDDFRNTYVALADLARRVGKTPRQVLTSSHATPVCGPSIDGLRQYFFRRADICAEQLPPRECRSKNDPTLGIEAQ